ncbi:MAG: DUF11 domain-containing protein [Gaiellaceae bacterium]
MAGKLGRRTACALALAGLLAIGVAQAVAAIPPNDDFANAQGLGVAPAGTTAGSLEEATAEPGEPMHGDPFGAGEEPPSPQQCGAVPVQTIGMSEDGNPNPAFWGGLPNPAKRSVWFTWTAAAAGCVQFDTIGSDFDSVLSAYTGSSFAELVLVAGNDDCPLVLVAPARQSCVRFPVVAGTTYSLAIDVGFDHANEPSHNYMLNWAFTPAAPVVQPDLAVTKTTTSTTVSVGDPISYTITVANVGPTADADDVELADVLVGPATPAAMRPSQGSCTLVPLACSLGTIAAGSSATVDLLAATTGPGVVENSAAATTSDPEPNTANNVGAAEPVTVVEPEPEPGFEPGCTAPGHLHANIEFIRPGGERLKIKADVKCKLDKKTGTVVFENSWLKVDFDRKPREIDARHKKKGDPPDDGKHGTLEGANFEGNEVVLGGEQDGEEFIVRLLDGGKHGDGDSAEVIFEGVETGEVTDPRKGDIKISKTEIEAAAVEVTVAPTPAGGGAPKPAKDEPKPKPAAPPPVTQILDVPNDGAWLGSSPPKQSKKQPLKSE